MLIPILNESKILPIYGVFRLKKSGPQGSARKDLKVKRHHDVI